MGTLTERIRRFVGLGTPALALAALGAAPPRVPPAPAPDFARDVRPLLAARCFACHGADDKARQAGLRLDLRESALARGALVAGKPERSQLLARVAAHGPTQMPPAGAGKPLTAAEVELLRRWIAAGAPYAQHWAFVKPVKPPVPRVGVGGASPIDAFIRAKLREKGIAPSPEADRYTLIRRVSLDLIGLPPTPEEVEAFVADTKPGAYERVVDRLLASPRYGERWARPWLDLARYADSAGYGSDPLRPNLWPWRDWVIRAFNENKRYDTFTIEQLAGDLLPHPSADQRVATAFHRNTMTNTEGGTSDEEFRMAAVKDRAIVTGQVWMGLTFQCAQCHTHKFDPIRQKDFYAFAAFFNQSADADRGDEAPTLPYLSDKEVERRVALDNRIAVKEDQRRRERERDGVPARFVRVTLPEKMNFLMLAEVEVLSRGSNVAQNKSATQSSTDFGGDAKRAADGRTDGNFNSNSVTHTAEQDDPWWEVDLGATVPVDEVHLWPRTDAHMGRMKGLRLTLLDEKRQPVLEKTLPEPLMAERIVYPVETPLARELADLKIQRAAIKPVDLPVMEELPLRKQRETHVLTLGNFLQPGEKVEAQTPPAFGALTPGTVPDRLALARWLVSPENPLTARVAVNRFWSQLFGRGIVETEEDFGTQGALPTHPELLDWLAVDFRESGWDIKRLLKTIVMSQTYRQSSRATALQRAQDPRNRLLARYPRRRLDAEGVRDQALALSGLLSSKIGGPSVFPPQPDGLWQAAFNGERTYPTSVGEDRYRRGLYTFWRRTTPNPSMAAFDAPSREFCTIRRQPTNTPLQALVTLNDPAYLEMARALGKRAMKEGGPTLTSQVRYALRLTLARPPKEAQVVALVRLYESERARYGADRIAAKSLAGDDDPDLAAWTVVANVLLNLDSVLTVG